MGESLASVALEGARLLTSVQKEKARYDYLAVSKKPESRADYSVEETLPGVELKSYVTRAQTDSETHVLVVDHREYLERLPVPEEPPTEEELAQEREDRKFMAKLGAGVASVAIVVFGIVVITERRTKPALPTAS